MPPIRTHSRVAVSRLLRTQGGWGNHNSNNASGGFEANEEVKVTKGNHLQTRMRKRPMRLRNQHRPQAGSGDGVGLPRPKGAALKATAPHARLRRGSGGAAGPPAHRRAIP
jgi:hypothetical protein